MGSRPVNRAVFLDRDGVINQAVIRDGRPYPPASPDALLVLPGVAGALTRLHQAGFRLVVVTNQPDVARGTQSRESVEQMHRMLRDQLPIDEFRVCYHDDADNCHCRKPLPGMLLDAAADADIDLSASFMIGDRWRDIEAGRRAGCTTLFIDYAYDEAVLSRPDVTVSSLAQAADWILARDRASEQNAG